MTKKKTQPHPRMQKGFGTIKYLGEGRTNPYAVFPPEYKISENGNVSHARALCYVPDWYTGFAILVSYKAGTYHKGDELTMAALVKESPEQDLCYVAKKILADYAKCRGLHGDEKEADKHKWISVYQEYMEYRFGVYATKRFSEATKRAYTHAGDQWSDIHDCFVEELTNDRIQAIVNLMAQTQMKQSIKLYITLLSNVMAYAIKKQYIRENPAAGIEIPLIAGEAESAEPYTNEELAKLWSAANQGNEGARSILTQVYSGFRLGAFYNNFEVHLDDGYFFGGVKARRDEPRRVVPIHPAIRAFVEDRVRKGRPVCFVSRNTANKEIRSVCSTLGISTDHTSHSARHTFKRLCDIYGVNPIASRVLMGHSLAASDVHDAVYTHFELEDLRREICKIMQPFV